MRAGLLTMTVVLDKEATRLTHTAAYALTRADMDSALEDLAQRLLRKDCRGLLEAVPGDDKSVVTLRLRPFAELVLREVTDIAGSTFDVATKERRVSEMLTLAGY